MILTVDDVSKNFGGLQALQHVSFTLREGQIMGLIGPNGAGKTTLFNVINGIFPPSNGTIHFRERNVTGLKPYRLARMGLGRTHQIVKPLNELSVRENVMVGACFGRQALGLAQASKTADEVMAFLGLESRAGQLAGSLNVAQKKRLELARALASRPYLLLLDEVLAGLNPVEIEAMVKVIKDIRQQGITILMIEHVMQAVMQVSDHVVVLDYGQPIAAGTPEEIAGNPKVIEAYLGDPNLALRLGEAELFDEKGPGGPHGNP